MTEPTHPRWPDGDLVEIGHLATREGAGPRVWVIDGIGFGSHGHQIGLSRVDEPAWGVVGGVKVEQLTRVAPQVQVAGEMPANLFAWLEDHDLEADRDIVVAENANVHRLVKWAKTLIEHGPALCGAIRVTPVSYISGEYPCVRPAGHDGDHRDDEGDTWGDVTQRAEVIDYGDEILAPERCSYTWTSSAPWHEPDTEVQCSRPAGHDGPGHRHDEDEAAQW